MTCSVCADAVDGVEVSPIQQRAVLRDLRRALVDPQLDGVVLARGLRSPEWKEGYDSAVECVDSWIEHLTNHIEGLAAAVPPVRSTSSVGGDLADAVARLREQIAVCETEGTGGCVMETPRDGARQMAVDLRLVLAALPATTPGDDRGRELAERPDRATPRDQLAGRYRALSDVLDDYLMREYGRMTSHNGWDLFLDLLAEQGYEVRALAAGGVVLRDQTAGELGLTARGGERS